MRLAAQVAIARGPGAGGCADCRDAGTTVGEHPMGKYFLAWLLGVPAIVLVIVYFFMH
jgi:hypothetical protein